MKLVLFTCADSTSVDQLTNDLSLFHIRDSFFSPVFPFALPNFTLVTWLEKDDDEPDAVELRTRWLLDGAEIASLNLHCDFQGANRTRALGEVGGIILPRPGLVEIQLVSGGKRMGTWEISVFAVGRPRIEQEKRRPTRPLRRKSVAQPVKAG